MPRTLEEIDADIAKFREALDELALGGKPSRMRHGDREIQFAGGSDPEAPLRRRLFELRTERARLTGEAAPGRPLYL